MALLQGRAITNGTAAPASFSGGLPFEVDGSIAGDGAGVVVTYNQALPFTANGRIATSGLAIAVYSSGQGMDATGRAVTS